MTGFLLWHTFLYNLRYICIVNVMRAILLLVVYTAFTASPVFAKHICSPTCLNSSSGHPHEEQGLPPSECSEKEAVNNNQPVEHRVGSVVKLTESSESISAREFRSKHVQDLPVNRCFR